MMYAQSGVQAIGAVEGCPGHTYDQRADQNDPHMSIDCITHERWIKEHKDPLWAAVPAQVPLTELEQRAADEAEAKASQVAAGAVANLTALLGAASANPAALASILQGAAAQAQAVPPAPAAPAAKRTTRRKPAAAKTTV